MARSSKKIIPRQADIGRASAEDDNEYFVECFIETGLTRVIRSFDDPRCILVGRTGSGKSAIIRFIEGNNERVIRLNPESLSLSFLADSWLLKFLTESDVNLQLFYQQLWRHVLVIELLRYEKGLDDKRKSESFLKSIADLFSANHRKKKAFEYLTNSGGDFWVDTEERVKSLTRKFEQNVQDEIGTDLRLVKAKHQAGGIFSEEEKTEITNNARKVVSSIQMQELAEIIQILHEDIFDDRRQKLYLVIDDLDTDWVDDRLRFDLIQALIQGLAKFRTVRNVKIIVAMRDDLLDSVLEKALSYGFQREKFDDYYARLIWNRTDLKSLVDKRISKLFRSQYTSEDVCWDDIAPGMVGDRSTFDYIADRTLMRPRDFILYINQIITYTAGKSTIAPRDIRAVELQYSESRRRSLEDEWNSVFPFISLLISFLKPLPANFKASVFSEDQLDDLALSLVSRFPNLSGDFISAANELIEQGTAQKRLYFRNASLAILYRVGAIGIKPQPNSEMLFSFVSKPSLRGEEFSDDTRCLIHPMLWQSLGKSKRAEQ